MGDYVTVGEELSVQASCSCGTCPSFSAKPLTVDPALTGQRFCLESEVVCGTWTARLREVSMPFGTAPDVVEFEMSRQTTRP